MMIIRAIQLLPVLAAVEAFSLSSGSKAKSAVTQEKPNPLGGLAVGAALASAVLVGAPQDAQAAGSELSVAVNGLPLNAIQLDVGDLPVVGQLVGGTFAKVDGKTVQKPSVVVKSPKNKIGLIKDAVTNGHIEVDLSGLVKTHLDVDIATDKAGVATIRVASPIIPKLPLKTNPASKDYVDPKLKVSGKKESDWYQVVNMGTGKIAYYYNGAEEKSQLEVPDKLF